MEIEKEGNEIYIFIAGGTGTAATMNFKTSSVLTNSNQLLVYCESDLHTTM